MTATASAIAFSACQQSPTRNPLGLSAAALAIEPTVDPASLEKPNLTVGFVPVNDRVPFAVAWEKGLFRKYGLNVTLSREASWANSRDGIIFRPIRCLTCSIGSGHQRPNRGRRAR